jgi:hypothetical protein
MEGATMGWKQTVTWVVCFASVAVAWRVYSELAGPRFMEGLKKSEYDMKRMLPMKVDDMTTLVDVKYEPVKTTYWYTLDLPKDASMDYRKLERVTRQSVCNNSETLRVIRDKGFIFEYRYMDAARIPLTNFVIASCP